MTHKIYQTSFENVQIPKACKALRKRRYKQVGFWKGWGHLLVKGLLVGAAAGLVSGTLNNELGNALGFLLMCGGVIWLSISYSKRAQASVKTAAIRQGIAEIKLTPEGYHATHPGYEALTRWSHVPDVVVTPQALLILHSDHEFYPIEAAAFKDAAEMQDVAAQIKEWIAAA